jgi:RimJ/RimL family protein N-acetyltransferase
MSVRLVPVTRAAAEAIAAGRAPAGLPTAPDYPTEFSLGVARSLLDDGAEPFFVQRAEDDVVVGEIGAAFVEEGVLEIGYAIVSSEWGRGHATAAVRELIERARAMPRATRIIAHTPPDRPNSGRVLEKAGFTKVGEVEDEHEGETIRVTRWELAL